MIIESGYIMKKANIIILVLLLSGCSSSVSLEDYTSLEVKYEDAEATLTSLKNEEEKLNNKYKQLKEDNDQLSTTQNDYISYQMKMKSYEGIDESEIPSLIEAVYQRMKDSDDNIAKEAQAIVDRIAKETQDANEKAARMIAMPFSSQSFSRVKRDYKDVVKELQNAGFTNIKMRALNDLVTGFLYNDGEVKEILINQNSLSFVEGDLFDKETELVVCYHCFPPEAFIETEKPQKQNNDSQKSNKEDNEKSKKDEVNEEVVTKENNPEFALLLKGFDSLGDPKMKELSDSLKGRIVQFDGMICTGEQYYDSSYFNISFIPGNDRNNIKVPLFGLDDFDCQDLGYSNEKANKVFNDDWLKVTIKAKIVGCSNIGKGGATIYLIVLDEPYQITKR